MAESIRMPFGAGLCGSKESCIKWGGGQIPYWKSAFLREICAVKYRECAAAMRPVAKLIRPIVFREVAVKFHKCLNNAPQEFSLSGWAFAVVVVQYGAPAWWNMLIKHGVVCRSILSGRCLTPT